MSFTGERDRMPVRIGVPIGDLTGSLFANQAILAALYQREMTGKGQKIDISLLDCQISLLTYRAQYYFLAGEIPIPVGTEHVSLVPTLVLRAHPGCPAGPEPLDRAPGTGAGFAPDQE